MSKIKDSGSKREFGTGAHRDAAIDKGRCDLVPLDVVAMIADMDNHVKYFGNGILWDMVRVQEILKSEEICKCDLSDAVSEVIRAWCHETKKSLYDWVLEVAHHYEDGAKKYGENNWQKGMPIRVYFDSALRHYFKYKRGDVDERHDRAFVWNMFGMLWTIEHKMECVNPDCDEN